VVVSIAAPMSEEKLSALLEAAPKEAKEPELLGKKKEEEAAPAAETKGEGKAKKEEEKKEPKAK
jgi:hypothetical protein